MSLYFPGGVQGGLRTRGSRAGGHPRRQARDGCSRVFSPQLGHGASSPGSSALPGAHLMRTGRRSDSAGLSLGLPSAGRSSLFLSMHTHKAHLQPACHAPPSLCLQHREHRSPRQMATSLLQQIAGLPWEGGLKQGTG